MSPAPRDSGPWPAHLNKSVSYEPYSGGLCVTKGVGVAQGG